MNYNYIQNFRKSRQNKIGASDIPWLIPSPNRPSESLAAYTDNKGQRHANTALDLYNQKVHGKQYEYSFPADMGHYLEGKALYEFIADNISKNIALDFLTFYQRYKIEQEYQKKDYGTDKYLNPAPYNLTPFKHHTEASNDYGVAHADCVYDGNSSKYDELFFKTDKIKSNGLTIDLSRPFIIEAKSANLYSVMARKKDHYKGYDPELKTHQGIPLSVYMQIQFQLALYQIKTAYVSLIFNTNSKHYWQIEANRRHQKDLIQLASYMKQCIDKKTPPKELIMNSKDILALYENNIKDGDFREVKDDELKEVLEIAKLKREAEENKNLWSTREDDLIERMSIHLKDTEQIKAFVNGSLQTIAKWKKTGGGQRLMGLADIKKRDDNKRLLRYLEKNDLIKELKQNIKPSIIIKIEEIEECQKQDQNN